MPEIGFIRNSSSIHAIALGLTQVVMVQVWHHAPARHCEERLIIRHPREGGDPERRRNAAYASKIVK